MFLLLLPLLGLFCFSIGDWQSLELQHFSYFCIPADTEVSLVCLLVSFWGVLAVLLS